MRHIPKFIPVLILLLLFFSGNVLAATPSMEELETHVDKSRIVNPENTTIHMFDYWLSQENDPDNYQYLGNDENIALKSGINKDRVFLFGSPYYYKPAGWDTVSIANICGGWNGYYSNWAKDEKGNVTTLGGSLRPAYRLVSPNLKDGYPFLNLTESDITKTQLKERNPNLNLNKDWQSLKYLFDPNEKVNGKHTVSNVKDLFKYDDSGYYEFNSEKEFAYLDKETAHITRYKTGGATSPVGSFFPFTKKEDLPQMFNKLSDGAIVAGSAPARSLNYYFGMVMESKFQQPVNGTVSTEEEDEEPMTFSFSGDDDVWIYIDDVLVGDIGGIHDKIRVDIDFKKGQMVYDFYDNWYDDREKYPTKLEDFFKEAKKEVTWKEVVVDGQNIKPLQTVLFIR